MEYCFDIPEIIPGYNTGDKIFFIHVIGDIQIDQIDKFGAVFQVIHD